MILDWLLFMVAKNATKKLSKDLRALVELNVKDEDKKKLILSKIDLAEFAIRKRDFGMANIILEDLRKIAIEIKSANEKECNADTSA